jgi:hypothetical protein
MRLVRNLAVLVAAFAALIASAVAPAHGATLVYSGTFAPNDTPTMHVVKIGTPNCVGSLGEVDVAYHEYPVEAVADGDLTVAVAYPVQDPPSSISVYLMQPGWDPEDAREDCLAASNLGTAGGAPATFTYPVVAGGSYVVVVFDDTIAQVGGSYQLTVTGPVNGPGLVTPSTRPEVTVPPTTAAPTTTTAPPTTTSQPTTTTAPPTTTSQPTTSVPATTLPATRPSTTVPSGPGGGSGAAPAAAARPIPSSPSYTG